MLFRSVEELGHDFGEWTVTTPATCTETGVETRTCSRCGETEALIDQLCLTLCNSMHYSPPGSSVHRFLQVRILSGWPLPSPGDLPNPGIEPTSPALWADALTSEPPGKPKDVGNETLNDM